MKGYHLVKKQKFGKNSRQKLYLKLYIKSVFASLRVAKQRGNKCKKVFKVSWFLILLEVSLTVLLQNTKSSSVAVTLKICLFEIQGQILCLRHCRDSFVWNRRANSVTVGDSFV